MDCLSTIVSRLFNPSTWGNHYVAAACARQESKGSDDRSPPARIQAIGDRFSHEAARASALSANDRRQIVGSWERRIGLQVRGTHAMVTTSGHVLLNSDGDDTALWDPKEPQRLLALDYAGQTEGYYCGGHTILPNGQIAIMGGTGERS